MGDSRAASIAKHRRTQWPEVGTLLNAQPLHRSTRAIALGAD